MVSGQNELMNPSLFLIVDCVCKVSGRLAIHAILKVSLKGQTVQDAKWINEARLKNCQTLLPDELDLNSLTVRDVSKANDSC